MNVHLAQNSYGKSKVRLTKVTRSRERHELKELSVDILLQGAFEKSYLTGDNSQVIATDTMKNTVYALAANHPLTDNEGFALALADHFIDRNSHVTSASVRLEEPRWHRITTQGAEHRHAFVMGGSDRRTCHVHRTREALRIGAGITGLSILKTTDSAFKGFLRDEFTTLAETDDRIFATVLDAEWTYRNDTTGDWNGWYNAVRGAMLDVFANHKSLAVQQTLYAMGEAALATCPAIEEIYLAMPNQHRIPLNLAPLGLENRNEIFVTTSEPYGLITATLRRGAT